MLPLRVLFLLATTFYQAIACYLEDRLPPPGRRVDVGGYQLHYVTAGEGRPTIVLDHSLGGVEGYLLLDELAKRSRVCIYDRAGFGWSDRSPYPRTSDRMHDQFAQLSTNCVQLQAEKSGHFVWVDQPDVIFNAVDCLLNQVKK